jgi:TRAP-type C4-dicarboxylate transport system permease large subunit
MVALYGGFATPSETAGLGAILALVLDRAASTHVAARDLRADPEATLRESTMLMLIIGMSLLYSYVMSYLHISQIGASGSSRCTCRKWLLLAASCPRARAGLLPAPGQIILMTAPIILPPLKAAGFDSDLVRGPDDDRDGDGAASIRRSDSTSFVISNIAPDIPLRDVIWGVMPFVALMFVAVFVLCGSGNQPTGSQIAS